MTAIECSIKLKAIFMIILNLFILISEGYLQKSFLPIDVYPQRVFF